MNDILLEIKTEAVTAFISRELGPVPHLHRELELIYVERGSVRAFADKKCYELESGDVFLSFPNQVHYYENSIKGKYYIVIFSPDTIFGVQNTLSDNVLRSAVIKNRGNEAVSRLIKKIPINSKESLDQTLGAGILNQIMAMVLKNCELKPRIKSDNGTLQNILDYCEHNFESDLTLEKIAEILHLNKYHISHLLNQKLGVSFSTYINALRINKACDLLHTTDKKTSDISEEVGFGSIRSFNRAFMNIMNTTPLKYRSQINPKGDTLLINN